MGLLTAATTNFHLNGRLRLKSRSNVFSPKVVISVLFAAYSLNVVGFKISQRFLGMTDMFAPVSMRKLRFVFLSFRNRRCDFSQAPASVSANTCFSFPSLKGAYLHKYMV